MLRAVAPREDRGVTRSEIGGHVARPLVEVLGDDDQERRGVEAIDVGHPTEGEFVALLAERAWREGAVTTKTRRSRAVSRRLPWHVPARTWRLSRRSPLPPRIPSRETGSVPVSQRNRQTSAVERWVGVAGVRQAGRSAGRAAACPNDMVRHRRPNVGGRADSVSELDERWRCSTPARAVILMACDWVG